MNGDTSLHTVGVFQARNTLGTLLDWVEAGDEVMITRRGRAVACLVSVQVSLAAENRAADAAARIRDRGHGRCAVSRAEWKAFRDAGRK